MSSYQHIVAKATQNRNLRLAGGYTCLPWLEMNKLSSVLPGVQQARYVIVTANSKVGKTQVTDFLYLIKPLEFIYNNPDTLKLKIKYFSLEVSKEDKLKSILAYKLLKDHGLRISSDKLYSEFTGETNILSQEHLRLMSSYDDYFNWFEEHVEIIDHIRNPYGIYKHMREYAQNNGRFYFQGQEVFPSRAPNQLYDTYVANDPNEYVIVITDHISLLQPEGTDDLWKAMFKYSSNYCLKMRDNFKYTVVNVQQQAADQEKQQFTFKGESIINKIKPSADGLGDCKLTGRDCDLMLGLFAPARYNIGTYPLEGGYDITQLKDTFRELSVILNRRGSAGKNIPLYFNGESNYFEELPSPQDIRYRNYL